MQKSAYGCAHVAGVYTVPSFISLVVLYFAVASCFEWPLGSGQASPKKWSQPSGQEPGAKAASPPAWLHLCMSCAAFPCFSTGRLHWSLLKHLPER